MLLLICLVDLWLSRPSVMDELEALRTMKCKEEKHSRRDSVFSRISSYRQKWVYL